MITCQERLVRHQRATEIQLRETQRYAAQQRQRKVSCEQQYYRAYGIPLISKQTEKRYIKARDQNGAAEQQLAELREELERCRQERRNMVASSAQQFNEKGQVSFQRRGSVDTMKSKKMYLAYLQKGCAFWSDFDTYQAQVMLESAAYLLSPTAAVKKGPLDVDEVWKRAFNRTCNEYNKLQEEGNQQWGGAEVQYECDACHQTRLGWPRVEQEMLVCDQCSPALVVDSMPQPQKMKRLFHTFLFPTLS
ncbi:hypothetical protein K501DRAFT_180911 [Backusella circina FSU 941]|nr:hypothetical protein K501DRAFT_180911 [Backusella circina FSU 941]